jgi:hypothetical protein
MQNCDELCIVFSRIHIQSCNPCPERKDQFLAFVRGTYIVSVILNQIIMAIKKLNPEDRATPPARGKAEKTAVSNSKTNDLTTEDEGENEEDELTDEDDSEADKDELAGGEEDETDDLDKESMEEDEVSDEER